MTLAEIIRAQLATGKPLRVTRALLEALEEPPVESLLEEDVREYLPAYVLDDGTGDEANERERIEYAGAEIVRLRREHDEARRNASAWADERDAMRRERDEARFSLAERTAEREALIERVSVLEEERDEARESLAREQRRLSDRLDVDVLVGGASMHGADDALWRPGETRAECWARHIREAEERGARWMHAAAVECSRYIGADHAMPKLNVQRICEIERKAGEHE